MSESVFEPTPWSIVMQAAGDNPERARAAFERLCGAYCDAITHWMRLQRLSKEDAEDAAQDFLYQWLRRENPLDGFQRGERRFREFLRVCLRRYLISWRAARGAGKRGGEVEHVAWEHDDTISDGADSLANLDFAVATQIHASTLAALQERWQSILHNGSFERLQTVALGTSVNPGSHDLAKELGTNAGTLRAWVFRFRREYHDVFRSAVSRQADPGEIDRDLLHLHQLLLQPPRV
jgi:DNA-directed RNA polymerase specialized sigma24 family protein